MVKPSRLSKRFSRNAIAVAAGLGFAASAAAASIQGDEITLRMGSGHPPFITYVKWMKDFVAPEVQKRVAAGTQYKVKFNEHYAGTVVNVFDTLEGVQDGRLDIGGWCVCFDDDKAMAMNLPYFVPFQTPDGNAAMKVFRRLVDERSELHQDYEKRYNQRLIGMSGFNNYGLLTAFDWKTFADLKGHKILAAGPNLPWVRGGIPVRTTIPTAAQQLQTGVGEGIVLFPDTVFKLKLHESAKFYTNVNFGAVVQISLTMNLDARKKLPKEVVAIIDQVAREYETKSIAASMDDHDWGLKKLQEAGVSIRNISPEAAKAWAMELKDWPNERAQFVKEKKKIDMPSIMRSYIKYIQDTGFQFPVDYVIK